MGRNARMALFAVPVLALVATVVIAVASSADAAVSGVEAESMHTVEGYGSTVARDDKASGGRMLKVDSNVSVRATFTLDQPVAYLRVMAHTDRGVNPGALTSVSVDGRAFPSFFVNAPKWTPYSLSRALAPGQHELVIRFRNARERNLYLDVVQFYAQGNPPAPPSATDLPSVQPTPATPPVPTMATSRPPTPPAPPTTARTTTPPPAPAPPPPPPSSPETVMQAYVTGYSWFDNTPPGSSAISFPVLHSTAGGTGTFADPITVAVGHTIANGRDTPDWPAGTRFYIPNLRRYFMVEDACGDGSSPQNGPCHKGFPAPATTWLDVWVGGQGGSSNAANACMDAITDVWTAIKDPAANYVVVPGDISGSSCTQQFGNTTQRT